MKSTLFNYTEMVFLSRRLFKCFCSGVFHFLQTSKPWISLCFPKFLVSSMARYKIHCVRCMRLHPHTFLIELLNCDNLRMGTDLHTELSVQKMCLKMECPASCDFFGNTLLHFPSHLYGFSVLTHGIVASCTISASELCKTLV